MRNFSPCLVASRRLPLLALAGLLASPAQAQTQAATFDLQATSPFAGNGIPDSIAVADANGDGQPDVLTASAVYEGLGVLLGNGQGSFTLQANQASIGGGNPRGITVADVNGDGKADALVANANTNTLGILLGDGQGGFTLHSSLSTGSSSNPYSVAVADVNGDGKADALVANSGTNTLGVLLGNGQGDFTLQANSPTTGSGSVPRSIAVADVNSDGKLDVLVANAGAGTLGVLLGAGQGSFTLQANSPSTGSGSSPQSIAVGDVNGDGRLDALVTNYTTNTLGVLLGNGQGGFTLQANSAATGGNYPNALAVADVNGDGQPDALVTGFGANTLGVLLGNGQGGFSLQATQPATGLSSSSINMVVADVNGDGKPDVLSANYNGSIGTLGVLLNTTTYPMPTLGAISPTNGPVGTRVTLTGTNLSSTTGVRFGGTPATTFAVVNATTVTATVPVGAGTGAVTLTTPGGPAASPTFTVSGALATLGSTGPGLVSVCPNPTQGIATLSLTGLPVEVKQVQATVLDALGRLVSRLALVPSQGAAMASLPTAGLEAGMYVLWLRPLDAQGMIVGTLPAHWLSVR